MDYAAEARREHDDYRKAVAALTPEQRDAWSYVEASYEWFDGESAIAQGTLESLLANGTLIERGAEAKATGWY